MGKRSFAATLAISVLAACATAQPSETKPPPHKNKTVAQVAGIALHVSQDVQTLQHQVLRQHKGQYGPSVSQVRADRKLLQRTNGKIHYFKRVKQRSEGQ
ncbi:MAG: hypothetical protein M3Y13_15765 [Armatimonadota bacterium]|nr:hypothetical protein [Armatimonadota bacterium]